MHESLISSRALFDSAATQPVLNSHPAPAGIETFVLSVYNSSTIEERTVDSGALGFIDSDLGGNTITISNRTSLL